jgi:dTMP kinase
LDLRKLETLEQLVHGDLQPDLTLLFDIPLEVALTRLARGKALDRFEQEQRPFFERVRQGYLVRARRFPNRFVVVDGNRPVDSIRETLTAVLRERGWL